MKNSESDSSLISRQPSEASAPSTNPKPTSQTNPETAALPFRLVARLGQNILNRIVPAVQKHPTGEKMLKSYSSGLIWGKEYTRNSSFNWMLNYLPDMSPFLGADPSRRGGLNGGVSTSSVADMCSPSSEEGFEPLASRAVTVSGGDLAA